MVTIILTFRISHVLLLWRSLPLHMALSSCPVSSHVTLWSSLEHFSQGGTRGHKLPSAFIYLGTPWSFLHFLGGSFARHRALGWPRFLFESLLASRVSDEHLRVPHMWCVTPFLPMPRFCLYLVVWKFCNKVLPCRPLRVYFFLKFIELLGCLQLCLSSIWDDKLMTDANIISSNILFAPFSLLLGLFQCGC